MKLNHRSLIALILVICLMGCMQKTKEVASVINLHYKAQSLESRDSVFVLYTLKEWHRLDWWTFRDYSKYYEMNDDQEELFFGDAFYSPDKKKMIVFVGEKGPNAKTRDKSSPDTSNNKMCPGGSATIVEMSAVIGFKDDMNTVWHLYPLNNEQAGCWDSKEEAINILRQYYFKQMKEHSENVRKKYLDKNYGGEVRYDLEKKAIELDNFYANDPMILKNYGYNIQDKDFWNKSLLWQKGAITTGYYDFQLLGVDPLKRPTVNYPDSILKLYQ